MLIHHAAFPGRGPHARRTARATAVALAWLWMGSALVLSTGPGPAFADTPLPHRQLGTDGAPMALVPAGTFTMGSADGQADEQPPHSVFLPNYYLDVYEVTVSRYARFLKGVNAEHPMAWAEATDGRHWDKPVVGIDWFDAKEYCEWVGRRLPTEAEWEKAARGTDERRYPWGDAPPTPSLANFGRLNWKGYATVSAVGAHQLGHSPYGIADLAGNVWEWMADRYDGRSYATRVAPDHSGEPTFNPQGAPNGPLRVLRGGSWSDPPTTLRASNRGGYPPGAHRSDFGFRCAADAAR